MWYAQNPGRRARQITGDVAVLLWTAAWTAAAVAAHRLARLLTLPRPADGRAGSPAARLPLVGDRVDHALRGLADAAGSGDPAAVRTAVVTGAAVVFLVPVSVVLSTWLPRRLRWVRQAAAAQELAASDDGRELLALRSLLRPLDEVAATAESLPGATPGSLAEGWRDADPETLDALADAELERLGLRLDAQLPHDPLPGPRPTGGHPAPEPAPEPVG